MEIIINFMMNYTRVCGRAQRQERMKNRTLPEDSINKALMEFHYGRHGSTKSQGSCYNFRVVKINRVVDGDTIDVTIDLGFDLTKKKESE